ncbi:MAG TPA: UDP-glucose/GDP-mannose dehydrogenase family protein [Bacteroidales bacterium]|nr:UDP-glucose/GDP-mannose dehydrogenase family protein [Bacteroidales bacterium]HOK75897.1 UDP-glucose/GDP-mannose dehydrogenase family protein [Bacteroidales bacterium]HOM41377.1 UDP-glucose/GDP-mannose dehydrogenase family protein [Bacteroidales bacterium]HOU31499.1 UDP-glucose/GDP-mannose dehydrogenase family protein [Bacteroidales bacterium]HPP92838.1 UDP-glucose/GDP-mannose dehydrogenase family protein [Bacteroidales bacterium]
MKIVVAGTGYVGLVTGTCFAETGVTVTCVDIDKEKIKLLQEGKTPLYEPGLEPMMKRNIEKGRLSFTTDLEKSLEGSEAIFIAVGTPPGEDGSADLQHVLKVASEIGKNIKSYVVVVIKSTVPVGTSEKVRKIIREELEKRGVDIPFDMASNPEFLKEGSAVEDFLRPERIVIGTENERAAEIMSRLYKPFVLNNHPIYYMDIPSAELTKYAANAMLATRISFINEIANLCELLGADINQVRKGIGSDSRIGNKFLYPGPGYGGSCFPKDVKALIRTAAEKGYEMKVIAAVEKANEYQKNVLFFKIRNHFNNNLKGRTIGIWGLSFKPHTDDIRESPSIYLIEKLLQEGAIVKAYDPAAMEETKKVLGNRVKYASDQYEAVIKADALVLVTEWPEFRLPDLKKMAETMRGKVIFDGRNIYDPLEVRKAGFTYYSIGRK